MFLANSLKDKIKRNFLENSPNTLEKAKFSYSPPKKKRETFIKFYRKNSRWYISISRRITQ